jgi:hypothetical protein
VLAAISNELVRGAKPFAMDCAHGGDLPEGEFVENASGYTVPSPLPPTIFVLPAFSARSKASIASSSVGKLSYNAPGTPLTSGCTSNLGRGSRRWADNMSDNSPAMKNSDILSNGHGVPLLFSHTVSGFGTSVYVTK